MTTLDYEIEKFIVPFIVKGKSVLQLIKKCNIYKFLKLYFFSIADI